MQAPAFPCRGREERPQNPLEHQQQAEAGDPQHPQHQGIHQIDPQVDSDVVPHRAEQGQDGQPHRGAHRQPEQAAQGPVKQGQGGQKQQGQRSPGGELAGHGAHSSSLTRRSR